jgi:hypothetical protein
MVGEDIFIKMDQLFKLIIQKDMQNYETIADENNLLY